MDDAHDEVTRLLTEDRDELDSLAEALLEHETLDEADAYAAAGVPHATSEAADAPPALAASDRAGA